MSVFNHNIVLHNDNSSVSFFARHSSMVADFNVGRLHEVVEPATLEAGLSDN